MNIEFTRSFLLWCTVINYGILLLWFLVFAIALSGCAASTADGFGYLMSSSTFFTILGCRFTRSEFFCLTWCHWLFYGSSAEDGRS